MKPNSTTLIGACVARLQYLESRMGLSESRDDCCLCFFFTSSLFSRLFFLRPAGSAPLATSLLPPSHPPSFPSRYRRARRSSLASTFEVSWISVFTDWSLKHPLLQFPITRYIQQVDLLQPLQATHIQQQQRQTTNDTPHSRNGSAHGRLSSFAFLHDFKSIFSSNQPTPVAQSNGRKPGASQTTNNYYKPTVDAVTPHVHPNGVRPSSGSSSPKLPPVAVPVNDVIPSHSPPPQIAIHHINHHHHHPHVALHQPISILAQPSHASVHTQVSSQSQPSSPMTHASIAQQQQPAPCISNSTTAQSTQSSSSSTCPPPGTRVPLSSIVTVLVDEWSRSYTVGALQGDIESMCMLSSAHFARSGFGCIPHDPHRGYDWLERAKKAVVEQAARDAKRYGVKVCRRDIGAKEKELEKDIITENCFTTEPSLSDQSLDDQMSTGSTVADSLASLSCGHDTNTGFINDVSIPSDASLSLPTSIESDSNICGSLLYDSSHTGPVSSHFTFVASSTPTSRRSSLRPSVSHPDLTSTPQWKKWTEENSTIHSHSRLCPPTAIDAALYQVSETESEEEITPPEAPNGATEADSPLHDAGLCPADGTDDSIHSNSVGSSHPTSSHSSEVDEMNSPTIHSQSAASSRVHSPANGPLILTRSTSN